MDRTRKILTASNIMVLIILPFIVHAQGTIEDYQKADSLRTRANKLVYNIAQQTTWIEESSRLWYRRNTRDGKEFMLVDAEKKTKQPAFDHQRLSKALSDATGKSYTAGTLPFNDIAFKKEGKELEFLIDDYEWKCNLETYECKKGKYVDPASRRRRWNQRSRTREEGEPALSPDSTMEAFIKNFNVYIRAKKDGEEYQLSEDGTEGYYYDDNFQWSPDSKKLTTNRVLPGFERLVHYVESSPKDQVQPKHTTQTYPKTGDVLTIRKPQLFRADLKKQIPVDDALFSNPYYIRRVEWRKDSRAFTFDYNQRGHQVYRIIEVDARTGKIRVLVDEQSKTFFCYYSKYYRHDVEDGKEIIWMSERDGWNHLYLYNGKTGKVKQQITRGQWVVRRVLNVDDDKQQITFMASGRDKDLDPYLQHCYRINFNGSGLIKLTKNPANHYVAYSDNKDYFVDTFSRADMAPVTVLCRASDGQIIMELEKADISDLVQTGWKMPEVFSAKGRDGKTDIWGIICRPTNFDPSKQYRVIEYIYAGPHDSFVPKSFRPLHYFQALAEVGFIVVQIDGMGTSNRFKAFHDVCYQNIKDAGFPDRILWHKAVVKKYPYYRIEEGVGIYGHSAGGQSSTGALLFHPAFYTVAVSSCGCHDNRMDKISWNEQWMGWPLGPHYAESSNVVHAHKLKGKLYLIVTELDTNVDPSSTLQVADALIKADKDFDYLIIPGLNHGIRGDVGGYVERRRTDFFVKHLLGIDPPDWNSLDVR